MMYPKSNYEGNILVSAQAYTHTMYLNDTNKTDRAVSARRGMKSSFPQVVLYIFLA